MHYGKVNDQLYVGSCPRQLSHIAGEMQSELGITAVVNLQMTSDIEGNCLDIIGQDALKADRNECDLDAVDSLRRVYEQNKILFIWIPIPDFSSTGRELMSPQAALVLKTMLDKGHRIYVHCNAGRWNLSKVKATLILDSETKRIAFTLVCLYF